MTLKEARQLRDEIRQQRGLHCTVPNLRNPDGSRCVRIVDDSGPQYFFSRKSVNAYFAKQASAIINQMIDEACGITEAQP